MHMLLPRQMTNHWTKLHLGKDGFSSEGSGMDAFVETTFVMKCEFNLLRSEQK